MRLSCLLVFAFVGACGAGTGAGVPRETGAPAPMDAARGAEADHPTAAADGGPSALPDAGMAPADAAATVEPSDGGWPRYVSVVEERYDQFSTRIAECFNGSRSMLVSALEPFDADPALAFDLGQLKIDEAAARACLAALGSATCDELARAAVSLDVNWAFGSLEPCSRILLRQPTGATCNHDEACMSGRCESVSQACGYSGKCAPPSPTAGPGESCSDHLCAAGTVCDANICRVLGKEGVACLDETQCVPGFFCAHPGGAGTGACRPVVAGAPCTDPRECPRVLACVTAATGERTCQPGRRVGEPCTTDGRTDPGSGRLLSDCGYGLDCLDLDGKGSRCSAGNALGAPCGQLPGQPTYVRCADGACELMSLASIGFCKAPQTSGPCSTAGCRAPAECRVWDGQNPTCQVPPPPRALGGACRTDDGSTCGRINYCRATTRPTSPDVASDGVCAQRKKPGESCVEGWDRCAFATACTNGVCTPC